MRDRFGFDWTGKRGTPFRGRQEIGRRLFFRHAGAAVGGYFLLPSRPMEVVARATVSPVGTARNCIFILLSGGASHTDTFDLKPGPWLPASFNPTRYNDVLFPQGLMPLLAEHVQSLAFVRSVRAWAAVHELSRNWIQIARNPISGTAKIAPHVGSIVAMELGNQSERRVLPAFVSLNAGSGPGEGYFPPEYGPFYVSPGGSGLGNTTHRDGPAAFERRYNLLLEIDAESRAGWDEAPEVQGMTAYNLAARMLMYNDDVVRVFTFDQNERVRYGNTAFGNACVTARNLLRARMGTRFVQITLGGWDNHASIYSTLNPANAGSLARQFDTGLGTLISDLKSDGLFDETLIVATGEFGRTVGALNSLAGRDHHLQQAVLMAGAKIRGRRAIGSTDAQGGNTAEPGWSRDRDIRPEDIDATIYSALGINWATVRRDDPLGRGFEYIPFAASQNLYGPVHELW
ncbi:MAG: DUF1501 domain-containing protein [Acidobacteria bacterium]|nr:DUF1501 domain-containing protein [Acidobacteriota bacterium]